MESGKYIELISYLRHDFLNHLQVISGYLQLGKNEKANEYIQDVTANLRKLSKVVHLKIPEVAAAFLMGEALSQEYQFYTEYNVESDLSNCLVPGDVAGNLILDCIQKIYKFSVENYTKSDSILRININEDGENHCCNLNFNISTVFTEEMENFFREKNREISFYDGCIDWEVDKQEEKGKVKVFLPRSCSE